MRDAVRPSPAFRSASLSLAIHNYILEIAKDS
jgi:hypothetical protein